MYISNSLKKEILERDNFSCQKCFYKGDEENLKIHIINKEKKPSKENLITLCEICNNYAPTKEEEFKEYIREKINSDILETFRKYRKNNPNIEGMNKKFEDGNIITRPPLGYKIIDKKLVVDEEKKLIVQEIFQTFLNENISLNKLAKKYNLSVNGLKKILKNFVYVGKIKFKGNLIDGKHPLLISHEIFNRVQKKLEEK
ncbi:MAG: recombinase family protein [Candidatus Pacearchaeota archaeon]